MRLAAAWAMGERQVAEALSQRICGITIVGLRDREEVVDRLAAIEYSDLDAVPPLVFPTYLVRRRATTCTPSPLGISPVR